MKHTTTPVLALAMTAMLALSGCMGAAEDQLGLASEDGEDNLAVTLAATNASDDIAHVGAALEGVFAHDAEAASGEGYYNLSLENQRADIVAGGETSEVTLASDSVPAGSYDEVVIRTSSVQAHGAAAMGDHGDHSDHDDGADGHDDGADGHDHGSDDGSDDGHAHGDDGHDNSTDEKSSKANLAVTTDEVDLPLDVAFEVPEDAAIELRVTLDVGASTTADSFSPVFEVTVLEDGESQTTSDVSLDAELSGEGDTATTAETPRPAARMTVFGPSGDQLYEPAFEVEQDKFVNTKTSAFAPGETIRFSGTESEAVADGAQLEAYRWDFDDGNTDTGRTVDHAFEKQGVFEVTLTVEDSFGVTGEHTLRLVVIQQEWTTTLVEESFEEGTDGWETASNGGDKGVPLAGAAGPSPWETTWEADAEGPNSSTAWHVGNHEAHDFPSQVAENGLAYNSNVEATLTSPTYTIPDDWTSGGISVMVGGASEADFDPLTIAFTAGDGNATVIGEVDTTDGWTQIKAQDALKDAAGQDVTLTITFTSDSNTEEGPGFFVDDVVIGGVDIPMQKAHLLEESGGGHDHGGHSH